MTHKCREYNTNAFETCVYHTVRLCFYYFARLFTKVTGIQYYDQETI